VIRVCKNLIKTTKTGRKRESIESLIAIRSKSGIKIVHGQHNGNLDAQHNDEKGNISLAYKRRI
jgi:hypothetical protein